MAGEPLAALNKAGGFWYNTSAVMGIRLPTFDYKSPYFYKVTLKAEKGALPFARIRKEPLPEGARTAPARFIEATAVTGAFVNVITGFHKVWRCLEPIECFAIMPDHIHLLIKLRKVADAVTLPKIVWQLRRHLERAYFAAVGAAAGNTLSAAAATSGAASRAGGLHIFERGWHDWIVKKDGQLAAFTSYIRYNPRRPVGYFHSHFQQINIDGQCERILLKYSHEKISDCAGCSAASRRLCIHVASSAKDMEHIVGEVRSRANRAR